jgi:hypothetical protein
VDGTQISGRELGAREYFVQKNNPDLASEEVREIAIHALTEERVLLAAAIREGLFPDTGRCSTKSTSSEGSQRRTKSFGMPFEQRPSS